MREITKAGLNLIKAFEGIKDGDPKTVNLDPYDDGYGYWTIGWGHLITFLGRPLFGAKDKAFAYKLYPGGLTVPQAEALLRADILDTCRDVETLLKVKVNDNQFAALVSFAFNIGTSAFKNSSLLKRLNAGATAAAVEQFGKWIYVKGKKSKGLVTRRSKERALFLTPTK